MEDTPNSDHVKGQDTPDMSKIDASAEIVIFLPVDGYLACAVLRIRPVLIERQFGYPASVYFTRAWDCGVWRSPSLWMADHPHFIPGPAFPFTGTAAMAVALFSELLPDNHSEWGAA